MNERFIIKFAGKIFQDVIISVFSKNVSTQICYNGRGGANSLVLISLGWFRCLPSFLRQGSSATHFAATQAMPSVLTLSGRLFHGPTRATSGGYFMLLRNEAIRDVEQNICTGDWFTATEVFHQHANMDVPVEWKMIYHWNNRIGYNQVTQITHLNFNWGMLGVSSYL